MKRVWKTTKRCGWMALLPLAGCVTVEAPDKPIVINLNIAIKQEVVYRLDGRAQELIQSEADIF